MGCSGDRVGWVEGELGARPAISQRHARAALAPSSGHKVSLPGQSKRATLRSRCRSAQAALAVLGRGGKSGGGL